MGPSLRWGDGMGLPKCRHPELKSRHPEPKSRHPELVLAMPAFGSRILVFLPST